MSWIDLLGLGAAFFTTISFLPQAIKVLKTRDTAALSLIMYIAFTAGVILWLIYGILKQDFAIISANAVTLCFAICILSIKIKSDVLDKPVNTDKA